MTKVARSAGESRGSAAPGDQTIEQVRELLFGEMQRGNGARFDALEKKLDQFQKLMAKRLDSIEKEIATLAESTASAQRDQILEMGKAVAAVGEQFKSLANLSDLVSQTDAKKPD